MDNKKIIAILLPLLACALQWTLWDYIEPFAWFFFFPATFFSVWIGGLRSGLLSVAVSAALAWAFFLPPLFPWEITSTSAISSTVLYVLTGISFSFFLERYRTDFMRDEAKASASLNEAETRFEATFEHAAVGIAHVSPEGRWLRVNRKLCEIVGYTNAELLKLTFQDITHPDDLDSDLSYVRSMLAREIDTYSMEKRYFRKDGNVVWIKLTVALLWKPDGTPDYFISAIEDIHRRKLAELALREREAHLQLFFEHAPAALAMFDRQMRYIVCSRRWLSDYQLGNRDVRGLSHYEVFPEIGDVWKQAHQRALTGEVLRAEDDRFDRSDGTTLWLRWEARPWFDSEGKIGGIVILTEDVTKRKAAEQQLIEQANFDPLTQLPNRRLFDDRLHHELLKMERDCSRIGLLFIDLDHFKDVNDTMGHEVGDQLLIEASHRIKACVRDYDTLARFGGDEFTVLLTDLHDLSPPARIAQAVIDTLSEPFEMQTQAFFLSASVGIALAPDDAHTATNLVKCADQAMYKAKNQGRRCFQFFTKGMQEAIAFRTRLATELRSALQKNQFEMYYQPIVAIDTGVIYKAEALLRWTHPQEGAISPAAFIPIAEETGFIVELGEWIATQVIQQKKQWHESQLADFQLSFNHSPIQFRQSQAAQQLVEKIHQAGIPGQNIVLEITESLLMNNDKVNVENLITLRDAGVQIAIDDFGTGYSALSYMKKFDIDYIKIDQSFTRNLAPDSTDLSLCEAIVVMAHKLGILVIAEGIETQQQRDLLRQIGCDFGQGYLFSPPLPIAKFESLLHNMKASQNSLC